MEEPQTAFSDRYQFLLTWSGWHNIQWLLPFVAHPLHWVMCTNPHLPACSWPLLQHWSGHLKVLCSKSDFAVLLEHSHVTCPPAIKHGIFCSSQASMARCCRPVYIILMKGRSSARVPLQKCFILHIKIWWGSVNAYRATDIHPVNRHANNPKKLEPASVYSSEPSLSSKEASSSSLKPAPGASKLALKALKDELDDGTISLFNKRYEEGYDITSSLLYTAWAKLKRATQPLIIW